MINVLIFWICLNEEKDDMWKNVKAIFIYSIEQCMETYLKYFMLKKIKNNNILCYSRGQKYNNWLEDTGRHSFIFSTVKQTNLFM